MLCSSELQFGFTRGLQTTQCTFSMLEIMDYYINFNKSSVNVLILDESKAFDRVKYCKLFAALLEFIVPRLCYGYCYLCILTNLCE